MAEKIKILVASHKPYWIPRDSIYLPIQVGAMGKPSINGFIRDDSGENISIKNPHYCELTALYWGWKNLTTDYLGLVHYRRHFKGSGERKVITLDDIEEVLIGSDVILPKARNYYIETIESHYAHTFDFNHIAYLRDAINKISPEYSGMFDRKLKMRSAHLFNMFIMKKELLNEYCSWMFSVLNEVEKRIDYSTLTAFEARVMGRLSERLLDTWISANNVSYSEFPIVMMEKTNWLKKGGGFLSAKFFGKKYKESF